MSRIQTILDKAEREGTARRFRTDVAPVGRGHEGREMPEGREPEGREGRERLEGRGEPSGSVEQFEHVARTTVGAPFEPAEALPPVDRVGTVAMPAPPADDTETLPTEPEPVADRRDHAVTRLPLSPSLVAALHPNALASEQFRTLRTRLVNSANGRGARSLLITSPGRGDGKSVMAANLALTMGQEIQQRVCLVDASLRDASVHALFGLPETPGLVDILNGEATLEDALVSLDEYQLTILPAGRLPRHPAELLASREMRRILDVLRSQFDRVVIDAPPAAPMADVSILTPLVDGVLMVVRAGVTETPVLQQALASLDQNRVLGVVLNDIQG